MSHYIGNSTSLDMSLCILDTDLNRNRYNYFYIHHNITDNMFQYMQ